MDLIESLKNKKEIVYKQSQKLSTVQPIKLTENSLEIESMCRHLDLLRGECQTYKIHLAEQNEIIKSLRQELMTASAKMTDVQGELTEKQKRELEKQKNIVIEQQRELSENRCQMAKLSEIIEKQIEKIESLNLDLT